MRARTSIVSIGRRSPVSAAPDSIVEGAIVATSVAASVMEGDGRPAAVAPLACPVAPTGGNPFASFEHAPTTAVAAMSARVRAIREVGFTGINYLGVAGDAANNGL